MFSPPLESVVYGDSTMDDKPELFDWLAVELDEGAGADEVWTLGLWEETAVDDSEGLVPVPEAGLCVMLDAAGEGVAFTAVAAESAMHNQEKMNINALLHAQSCIDQQG